MKVCHVSCCQKLFGEFAHEVMYRMVTTQNNLMWGMLQAGQGCRRCPDIISHA